MFFENELKVLADYPYDPIGSFRNGNPYAIAFCYCDKVYKSEGGFILKGGANDIDDKIKLLGFPMLVFKTFWRHGRGRGGTWPSFKNWRTIMSDRNATPMFVPYGRAKVDHERMKTYYRRWELKYKGELIQKFRRIPRKWLPEYTKLINH